MTCPPPRHDVLHSLRHALALLLVLVAALSAFTPLPSGLLHEASGETRLADGGWAAPADTAHNDGMPASHHHHTAEMASDVPVTDIALAAPHNASALNLRPGQATQIAGLDPSGPDQPPRI